MKLNESLTKKGKLLVKKCHVCGSLMESYIERKKCTQCKKSFLPTNYFSKVHAKNSKEFDELFSSSDDLHEEDLIKGISVLW
ncbi:MAG: hypothetical protein K9K67_05740 [Bacteriovoracaceae bacterium]|nr:hypothetical protein [Bacteriovoracaceae bacterium]